MCLLPFSVITSKKGLHLKKFFIIMNFLFSVIITIDLGTAVALRLELALAIVASA